MPYEERYGDLYPSDEPQEQGQHASDPAENRASAPVRYPVRPVRPRKRSNRGAVIIGVVIVIACAIVIAAVLLLFSTGDAQVNNNAQTKQIVVAGNYFNYSVSETYLGENYLGYERITFDSVASSSCVVSITGGDFPTFSSSTETYTYSIKNGVWTSPALTGVVLDHPVLKIGTEQIPGIYGYRLCDHYQQVVNEVTLDYYIIQGSGIPYKFAGNWTDGSFTASLQDTNINWVKNLQSG